MRTSAQSGTKVALHSCFSCVGLEASMDFIVAFQVAANLQSMAGVLGEMQRTLSRMGERCDPNIYYSRVRAYMQGWRSNPSLPQVSAELQQPRGLGGLSAQLARFYVVLASVCSTGGALKQ